MLILPTSSAFLVLTDNDLGVYKSNFLCMAIFSCCFVMTKSDHKTHSGGTVIDRFQLDILKTVGRVESFSLISVKNDHFKSHLVL